MWSRCRGRRGPKAPKGRKQGAVRAAGRQGWELTSQPRGWHGSGTAVALPHRAPGGDPTGPLGPPPPRPPRPQPALLSY